MFLLCCEQASKTRDEATTGTRDERNARNSIDPATSIKQAGTLRNGKRPNLRYHQLKAESRSSSRELLGEQLTLRHERLTSQTKRTGGIEFKSHRRHPKRSVSSLTRGPGGAHHADRNLARGRMGPAEDRSKSRCSLNLGRCREAWSTRCSAGSLAPTPWSEGDPNMRNWSWPGARRGCCLGLRPGRHTWRALVRPTLERNTAVRLFAEHGAGARFATRQT